MHVEGDRGAATLQTGLVLRLGCFCPAAMQEVVGQALSQVGLSCPTGPGQNQTPVFKQQADVMQHHGLRNQSLKHQRVNTLFSETWREVDTGRCLY